MSTNDDVSCVCCDFRSNFLLLTDGNEWIVTNALCVSGLMWTSYRLNHIFQRKKSQLKSQEKSLKWTGLQVHLRKFWGAPVCQKWPYFPTALSLTHIPTKPKLRPRLVSAFYWIKYKQPTDASDDMSVIVTIPGTGNDGDGSNCDVIILTMLMKAEMIFMMDADRYW